MSQHHILIVEDEEIIRSALRRLLERLAEAVETRREATAERQSEARAAS